MADHAARPHRTLALGGDEAKRAFEAMLTMTKIGVAAIEVVNFGGCR